jgi:hypothetical protein
LFEPLPLVLFDRTAAGMKHTHNKKAAPADHAVKFNKSECAEIVNDARAYLEAAGVAPTAGSIRQVILDNHGPDVAKAVCDGNCRKSANSTKPKKVVRRIFGFTVAAVARALGRAGVKPAAAVAAIHKHQPQASVLAIKTFVHAGRAGVRGEPAPLTAKQMKSLVAA